MQNHKLAQMQVVAQNTLAHSSLEQHKKPQLKTTKKRKVSTEAQPLSSLKKRQISTNSKNTKVNVSKYMSKEKRQRSRNSKYTEESMKNQAEDQYHNANISLRESFRHYRPDSEQHRMKAVPTKTSEASDRLVNTGDGNVISFQNTQTNFVEQLDEIQEQEITMRDQHTATSGRNQSQEFLQLLQYSDQLNSKIDKLKQSTQKVKSVAALRPGSVRSQLNQTTPPKNQSTTSIQRSSSKSMTRTKWNLSHNQTPPRRAPSSNRKASEMNTPQSPPSVAEDELTILKYELYKLRGQLQNQQSELLNVSQHSVLQISSRDMQIADCAKQKEGVMKLLKSRNENELKLQNEILEKNNLIKDLTKKLKESTQIILSINLKNGQMTKNYEVKLKEKLESKTAEMKKQVAQMQQEMQETHSQEVIRFTRKLEGVQKALQEAESFRGLYSQSKQHLSEMKEELNEFSKSAQQLHDSNSQRALLEESNQRLQDTINYLAQKLEDSKIDVYNMEEKEKEQKQKQKNQIQKVSEEYESLINGQKLQSQSIAERKDKEMQNLYDKIAKQEKMMEERQVAFQNEKDLMGRKVNEEIENMKQQLKREKDKFEQSMNQQTAASSAEGEVNKMKERIQEHVEQIQKLEQEKIQIQQKLVSYNESQQQLLLLENQVYQLKIQLDQRQEIIDTQAVELDKHLDLAQDVEILQKELEYSKIECAHLQSVIEQEKQRIMALENSDAAKDQQILQMKSLEQELTETIENLKIKSGTSSRTHLNHASAEHKQLLIEENEQLRHKEKELKKEVDKLQEQMKDFQHKAEYVRRVEEENKRLTQLKKDNEDLEKQIRAMQEELKSQSDNMKSSNHHRDQSIDQLQAQNQELQAEIKQQNKRTQSVDFSKNPKQSDIQPYEEQIQQLSMMLATQAQQHQQEKSKLQQKVSDLELEKDELLKQLETQKQQISVGEAQRVQLESEMSFLWEEQSKTQNQNDEGELEVLKLQASQKDAKIQKLEGDMSSQEQQIKTLINDKTELNRLILTMRNNLKNLRKVFLGQVKTGVKQQKRYLSQTRSQGSLQLDDGNQMISNSSSGRLSEDEISMISKVSIAQELKNLENEKELMTSAIADITESQHQNTQQVQENQKKLAQQLQQAQKLNEQSERTISDLKTQLQNETESLQQVIMGLKSHIGQGTAQLQELKKQGKHEKEMLIEQLQMVQQENAESLATIANLQSELAKVKEANQKQIEQITMHLITERQKVQELEQNQSKQPTHNNDSQKGNQMIKKLEYQQRQSQQDMETMKQALSQEALKRQESLEKMQTADNDNQDLRADVKQLTEELEHKEDEIMLAYQEYQKQLKSKEEDVEVLQFDLMQAREQLETLLNRSNNSPGKVSLTLEQEVEIEDLRNENDKLRMELERERRHAEDQLFDKDHEIKAMTTIVSMKDLEINQLATKLSLNQLHGRNDDELGQFFSNEHDQDNAYEMIHQKSPRVAQAKDFEQEFLSREQSNATFHSRDKDIEDDLNIYGTEDDSLEKANRNNGFHHQPDQSLAYTNQEESQHAPSIQSHVRGASISPQQPYKQQNMNINLQICETQEVGIDDSFDISKRVKTMNQGKLQASIENLDLLGSKQSLPDRNIVASKLYRELEDKHSKLQKDFNSLSAINKDLLQQLSTLTTRGDQLEKASSDTTSIFSANEDLKVQLKSKKQQVSSMKQMIESLERDRDNKEIMNKQLQIEMENYAEQVLALEEKNYTLEMTIESLTKQMVMLASAGNEQAKATRRQIEELSSNSATKNEEAAAEVQIKKKIRSFAQSSFLAPQNEEKEKKMAERERKVAEIKNQKANPAKPKLAITIASQSSSGSKKQQEVVQAAKAKKNKMSMF